MIDIHELRIGNYILVDNLIKRVCAIKADEENNQHYSVCFKNNNNYEYVEAQSHRLAAVPLSEQLLQDFGYTLHPYYKLWQHRKPDRTATFELNSEFTAVDFSHRPIVKHLQYVHRLQNLMYTLQKQELEFTVLKDGLPA